MNTNEELYTQMCDDKQLLIEKKYAADCVLAVLQNYPLFTENMLIALHNELGNGYIVKLVRKKFNTTKAIPVLQIRLHGKLLLEEQANFVAKLRIDLEIDSKQYEREILELQKRLANFQNYTLYESSVRSDFYAIHLRMQQLEERMKVTSEKFGFQTDLAHNILEQNFAKKMAKLLEGE